MHVGPCAWPIRACRLSSSLRRRRDIGARQRQSRRPVFSPRRQFRSAEADKNPKRKRQTQTPESKAPAHRQRLDLHLDGQIFPPLIGAEISRTCT